jgi:hypothetical protein
VGTFSCHGAEPIYDSDYRPDEEDDDDEDEWCVTGTGDKKEDPRPEKPTTAAKINQDRGGVAFPYGNCARTALFAVYDGKRKHQQKVSSLALAKSISLSHIMNYFFLCPF